MDNILPNIPYYCYFRVETAFYSIFAADTVSPSKSKAQTALLLSTLEFIENNTQLLLQKFNENIITSS